MIESIVKLSPDHESIPLFQFDGPLNREIRINAPRRNERIAPQVAVLAQRHDVTEVILARDKVAGIRIKSEGRVEVYEVRPIEAKSKAGVAYTVRILARRAEVDGDAGIAYRRPVTAAVAVAVIVEAGVNGLRRSAAERHRA